MTTKITEECINCGACEPECPNVAIYAGAVEYEWQGARHRALSDDFYYIVAQKCTECVGFFDREACAAACPVDCCIPDPQLPETEDVLIARAKTLHPDKDFGAAFPSRFRTSGREDPLPAPAPAAPAAVAAAAVAAAAATRAEPKAAAAAEPKAAVAAEPKPAAAAEPKPAAAAEPKAAAAAAAKPAVAAKPAAAAQKPVAAPQPAPAAAGAEAATSDAAPPPRRIPGTPDFEALKRTVCNGTTKNLSLRARLARLVRGAGATANGSPAFDGFTSPAFESKRERERRYGEVYSIQEYPAGYYVRLELPRKVPPSSAKVRLGIGDEMPDYDLDVTLHEPELSISGHVFEKEMRSLCSISTAFPADFRTSIRLAGKLAGVACRYSDKVLEIVVSRDNRRMGRLGA